MTVTAMRLFQMICTFNSKPSAVNNLHQQYIIRIFSRATLLRIKNTNQRRVRGRITTHVHSNVRCYDDNLTHDNINQGLESLPLCFKVILLLL